MAQIKTRFHHWDSTDRKRTVLAPPTSSKWRARSTFCCIVTLVPAQRLVGHEIFKRESQFENFAMRSGRLVSQSQRWRRPCGVVAFAMTSACR